MEWTKETLLNTCILITSILQGEKALKFYESFGFEIPDNNIVVGKFIRVASYNNNLISIYTSDANRTRIKLPIKPRRKFPREMMVSSRGDEWCKRMVVAKVKTHLQFIAVKTPYELTDPFLEYTGWMYAKEIE